MEFSGLFTLSDKLSSHLKGDRAAEARTVHSLALKLGCLFSSTFLSNNILHAYASSSANDAHQLLAEIPQPNAVTWSIMNSAYSLLRRIKDVILLFRRMQQLRVPPNDFVFGSSFTCCARARDLLAGIQIHCGAVKFGSANQTFVAGTMIDMYARCGKVVESWRVFDDAEEKDVVTWTTMITCLANKGQHECSSSAFGLFREMICSRIWPVGMTFVSVLKVFDESTKLGQATQVHGCMVKLGIKVDGPLGSGLITMYGRCGGVDEAVRVFDRIDNDVVSWTSLLVAYMRNGYYKEATYLLQKMMKKKLVIDSFLVASMIGVYSALEDESKGREIHAFVIRADFISDVSVGNSLITLYGRCRKIKKAEKVFQFMKCRDVISWTAMMTCYTQNDNGKQTFLFFRYMLHEGHCPAIFSITNAIRACSAIGSLLVGKQMHSRTIKMGLDANLSIENSLITMYAKCGSISSAFEVFDYMTDRDPISWNAMIMGFSRHGLVKQALELFSEMQKVDLKPDEYTFMGILVSCSHAGLVKECWKYFSMMTQQYGLKPRMEHYRCIFDLLVRSNKLHEAMNFIDAMPFEPDHLIWEAMLAASKVHADEELVKYAAKKILEKRPEVASPYISLSTNDTLTGNWDSKASDREKLRSQGLPKESGINWTDVHIWSKEIKTRESDDSEGSDSDKLQFA